MSPATPVEPVAGVVGGLYAAGQTLLTVTGRVTTPFPRVDLSTDRRAGATLRRVDGWMLAQALAEAEARGSNKAARFFGAMDAARLSPADKDECELYLFDPTWSAL